VVSQTQKDKQALPGAICVGAAAPASWARHAGEQVQWMAEFDFAGGDIISI